MVTKGLHFDDVSLVTVLQADTLLNKPDFRSYEHAFHMLEQVSGRAGRKGAKGEVIIQTFDPSHPVFACLRAHDYRALYDQQIAEREMFHFPPFYRLIVLTLKHRDAQRLQAAANMLQQGLQQAFGKRVSNIITPSVARVQNMYLLQIRLTIESTANIHRAKEILQEHIAFVQQQSAAKGTMIIPDIDPM